jgi:hypothetical protein
MKLQVDGRVLAITKISHLHLVQPPLLCQQQILGLEISVDHTLGMGSNLQHVRNLLCTCWIIDEAFLSERVFLLVII